MQRDKVQRNARPAGVSEGMSQACISRGYSEEMQQGGSMNVCTRKENGGKARGWKWGSWVYFLMLLVEEKLKIWGAKGLFNPQAPPQKKEK